MGTRSASTRSERTLTIQDVSARVGVSPSTLRHWEHEYGIPMPERTAGGHRRYDASDLAVTEAMVRFTRAGWSPAEAADYLRGQDLAPGDLPLPGTDPDTRADDVDVVALAAAHRAARALLRLSRPEDAVDVLIACVERLGGSVVVPDDTPDDTLPIDLSFGTGRVVLPSAPEFSLARMRLQAVLPALVEDARRIVGLLRAARLDVGDAT